MPPKKSNSLSIVVYDMGGLPLPDKLVRELQVTVDRLLKNSPNLAQSVVSE